jgi:hypothetical protein
VQVDEFVRLVLSYEAYASANPEPLYIEIEADMEEVF